MKTTKTVNGNETYSTYNMNSKFLDKAGTYLLELFVWTFHLPSYMKQPHFENCAYFNYQLNEKSTILGY
jgi:hypothetical protein